MEYRKKLYGTTIIDSSDSEEIQSNQKIELEYYEIQSNRRLLEEEGQYGVEIIKKKVKDEITDIEGKVMKHIFQTEKDICQLLEKLMNNKVTPISLEDVIADMKSV